MQIPSSSLSFPQFPLISLSFLLTSPGLYLPHSLFSLEKLRKKFFFGNSLFQGAKRKKPPPDERVYWIKMRKTNGKWESQCLEQNRARLMKEEKVSLLKYWKNCANIELQFLSSSAARSTRHIRSSKWCIILFVNGEKKKLEIM